MSQYNKLSDLQYARVLILMEDLDPLLTAW